MYLIRKDSKNKNPIKVYIVDKEHDSEWYLIEKPGGTARKTNLSSTNKRIYTSDDCAETLPGFWRDKEWVRLKKTAFNIIDVKEISNEDAVSFLNLSSF